MSVLTVPRVAHDGVAGRVRDIGRPVGDTAAVERSRTTPRNSIDDPLARAQEQRCGGLRPGHAAYLIVAVRLVAVVIFGIVEHLLDDQTFPTVWLGMWWALQTVTTVGYGDVVPQDTVRRAIASLLLLGGLALLSVVTATITSGFVARARRETPSDVEAELLAEIRELRARVDELAERLTR